VIKIPFHLTAAALFVWPFFGLGVPSNTAAALVVAAAFIAFAATELHARRLNASLLTLLAAIAAVDTILRAALVTGVGGFSPIFLLILCAGYAFGPGYGFLAGASTLLVSGVATGGIGPWLPYEMLAAGWVGALAGLAGLAGMRHAAPPGMRDIVILALVGLVCGFLYGALTDLWDWSAYYRGIPGLGWSPGMSPGAALRGFAHFYIATSAVWDSLRAIGDVIMIALLGAPLLAAFDRIRRRLSFTIEFAVPSAP
jgi:energy-coupling factor transport system substrate-specific component